MIPDRSLLTFIAASFYSDLNSDKQAAFGLGYRSTHYRAFGAGSGALRQVSYFSSFVRVRKQQMDHLFGASTKFVFKRGKPLGLALRLSPGAADDFRPSEIGAKPVQSSPTPRGQRRFA
jgi:hypothetical protein